MAGYDRLSVIVVLFIFLVPIFVFLAAIVSVVLLFIDHAPH